RRMPERRNRRGGFAGVLDLDLAFAVIAEASRLQHAFAATQCCECPARIRIAGDGMERRRIQTQRLDERLLFQAVLREAQGLGAWIHRLQMGNQLDRRCRHIFEFERHRVAAFGEGLHGFAIVELAASVAVGHLKSRRSIIMTVDVCFESQTRRRKTQHAAKLATAENPDCPARRHGRCQPFDVAHLSDGASATALVCSARHFASRFASAVSDKARIAAACKAAFLAPLCPMANVATGMPPGIWTMERRLSIPFSALDSTGTPNTGSVVNDAVIPGRCAAPPAPAMITLSPRPAALLA